MERPPQLCLWVRCIQFEFHVRYKVRSLVTNTMEHNGCPENLHSTPPPKNYTLEGPFLHIFTSALGAGGYYGGMEACWLFLHRSNNKSVMGACVTELEFRLVKKWINQSYKQIVHHNKRLKLKQRDSSVLSFGLKVRNLMNDTERQHNYNSSMKGGTSKMAASATRLWSGSFLAAADSVSAADDKAWDWNKLFTCRFKKDF